MTHPVPDPAEVDHPPHYLAHPSGVECIAITEHFNFNVGNAIKYVWRAGLKGDAVTDLRKARWYVDREIERVARASPFPAPEDVPPRGNAPESREKAGYSAEEVAAVPQTLHSSTWPSSPPPSVSAHEWEHLDREERERDEARERARRWSGERG